MFSVLIDTSAYEALQLSFRGKTFDSLKKLSIDKKIQIVGSEILRNEMETHLQDSIATSVNILSHAYKKLDRNTKGDLGDITVLLADESKLKADLLVERIRRMDDFFREVNSEELDISKVKSGKVFEDYFKIVPPFGEGGKRKEFPDAFVLHAFVGEYKKTLNRTCIVSSDSDWKNFAAIHPKIRFFNTIVDLIDFVHSSYNTKFTEDLKAAITAKEEVIKEEIIDKIKDGSFAVDDSWIDPEVELDTESVNVDINEISIISFNAESAQIQVVVEVSYEVTVGAGDEDASFKDEDTKTWVYFGRNLYSTMVLKEIDVEIEISYDSHPNSLDETLEVQSVSLPDELFYVDGDHHFELIHHWNDKD